MSPKLERDLETLDAFLADIDGVSLPPIPIPTPALPNDSASVLQALLEGQSALLQGVNELRANVVTKDHLRTFQALQSQAMHTYVQTELTPVHASFSELSSQVGALTDRIVRIEANPGQGSASGDEIESMRREIDKTHVTILNASDPALRQIAVLGFKGSSADERNRARNTALKLLEKNIQSRRTGSALTIPFWARMLSQPELGCKFKKLVIGLSGRLLNLSNCGRRPSFQMHLLNLIGQCQHAVF